MSHDPIDSLIYLSRNVRTSLDGLSEELSDRFGYEDENEDVAFLNGWIDSIKETVLKEAKAHFDGRVEYSTGVPFSRRCQYMAFEPNKDDDMILADSEASVDMHPDGSPVDPPLPMGMWIS